MTIIDICMVIIIINMMLGVIVNTKVYKVFADKGYIFDKSQLKEIERNDLNDASLFEQILYECASLIPFYNLLVTLTTYIEYCMYTDEYIDAFNEFGIIEKMNDREQSLYNKKKKGIYAIFMRKKLSIKRKNKYVIMLRNGDSIWYDYNKKLYDKDNLLDSITIIEGRGTLERKTEEELRNIVYESHFIVAESILNSYDSSEAFLNDKEKDKKIELALEIKKEGSNKSKDELSFITSEEQEKKKIRKRKK